MSENETPTPPAARAGNGNGRVRVRKRVVLMVLLLAMAAAALTWHLVTRDKQTTDDAQVDGTVYRITPRVTGYVTEVLVTDNQWVKKGDPLVRLDRTEFEVALAQERASLASLELDVPLELSQTRLKVAGAEADVAGKAAALAAARRQTEAAAHAVEQARAADDQAGLDLERVSRLFETRVASQSELDEARTRKSTTAAALRAAKARLGALRREESSLARGVESLRAAAGLAATGTDSAEVKDRLVKAQRARVRQAELDLEHTVITAPGDGYVTRKSVEAGLVASKGQQLMRIAPLTPDHLWITANYKETQLTDVRPGQPVDIEVDTYPGLEITGTVESIMAGTGAAFALFPPENASGNYVKIVQRIPVRIRIDPGQGELPPLRIGMSVVPTIHTDASSEARAAQ